MYEGDISNPGAALSIHTNRQLPTNFQEFIYKRTYSRWMDEAEEREDFLDSISRYGKFMYGLMPFGFDDVFYEILGSISNLAVMPSMRSFWTAGPALERENVCAFNCSAAAVDHPDVFAEALYILMCGSGFGFSVERQFIAQLPEIPAKLIGPDDHEIVIVFEDSKLGWAKGFKEYVNSLYAGVIPGYDLSKIRDRGARLKTFGGRASGPEPLRRLLVFAKTLFESARGRRLNSIECHDLMCYIASIVVVGGTRRSATISLSNLSDKRMAHAKDGEFWKTNPQRSLANNSVAYTEKPDTSAFMEEWLGLMRSGAGERGIFNRAGAVEVMKKKLPGRNSSWDFLPNPCGEILLRPMQFCNLSEPVVRQGDALEDLKRKVEQATILGCLQSKLTNFNFLRDTWRENTEEERLLGVSLTGLRDHSVLNHVHNLAKYWLSELKLVVWDTAKKWAKILDINVPAAITCVKPSGTVSLLVDSSSGLHPRFARYYIRRVRVSRTDPMCQLLMDSGVKWEPEVGEEKNAFSTAVFEFYQKSPVESICNDDVDAIEMLEYWLMLKQYWCDHNPSCTIFVAEQDWVKVGNWVYENWDEIAGLSFLPRDNMVYQLAPYEKITKEAYEESLCRPDVDFSQLSAYEIEDNTIGAQEVACGGSGSCELI